MSANTIGRATRRPASPLNAGRQFESTSCTPPSLSAVVAHLARSAKRPSHGARRTDQTTIKYVDPQSITRGDG